MSWVQVCQQVLPCWDRPCRRLSALCWEPNHRCLRWQKKTICCGCCGPSFFLEMLPLQMLLTSLMPWNPCELPCPQPRQLWRLRCCLRYLLGRWCGKKELPGRSWGSERLLLAPCLLQLMQAQRKQNAASFGTCPETLQPLRGNYLHQQWQSVLCTKHVSFVNVQSGAFCRLVENGKPYMALNSSERLNLENCDNRKTRTNVSIDLHIIEW